MARRALFCSVLALAVASGPAAAEPAAPKVKMDCVASSLSCPPVMIQGDPWSEIPGIGPSPFRGYGDPSIRKDPSSDRLWLTYSYLSLHTAGAPAPEFGVGIHLASSDDGGDTWQFRRRLQTSAPEIDPGTSGDLGVSVHEVSTVAPLESGSRTDWYAMHLRYFQPFGPEGRRPQSFHFRLARANKPTALGRKREAVLAGPLLDPAWRPDVDLSRLDPALGECSVWTEPALFADEDQLYLVAQCLVVDIPSGTRRPNKEFLGVFAASGGRRADRLAWRWIGKLAGSSDARSLGADVLTQADLAWSRDGTLLLLVTPKRLEPTERHRGCRVLELESLNPPRLKRRANGKPVVRADIRSSDSTGLGPGLCAYDAASATGVLFVRTEIDLATPDIVFSLHATGVHP